MGGGLGGKYSLAGCGGGGEGCVAASTSFGGGVGETSATEILSGESLMAVITGGRGGGKIFTCRGAGGRAAGPTATPN